jgi:hypothetical protein
MLFPAVIPGVTVFDQMASWLKLGDPHPSHTSDAESVTAAKSPEKYPLASCFATHLAEALA